MFKITNFINFRNEAPLSIGNAYGISYKFQCCPSFTITKYIGTILQILKYFNAWSFLYNTFVLLTLLACSSIHHYHQ